MLGLGLRLTCDEAAPALEEEAEAACSRAARETPKVG